MSCPSSIFLPENPTPVGIIVSAILQIFALPMMAMGLFISVFGNNFKTLVVAFQALAIAGVPAMMPTILLILTEVRTIGDILNARYFTMLMACALAGGNAIVVVIKLTAINKARVSAFSTGALLSGVTTSIWLPVWKMIPGIPGQIAGWVTLVGTLAPAIYGVALASNPNSHDEIYAVGHALLGGGTFIGVLSGWMGGGDVSLSALAAGELYVCSLGGLVSTGAFMAIVGYSIYANKTPTVVDDISKPPPIIPKAKSQIFWEDILEKYDVVNAKPTRLGRLVRFLQKWEDICMSFEEAEPVNDEEFEEAPKRPPPPEPESDDEEASSFFYSFPLSLCSKKAAMESSEGEEEKYDNTASGKQPLSEEEKKAAAEKEIMLRASKVNQKGVAKLQESLQIATEGRDVYKFFARFDADRSGSLDPPEFLRLVRRSSQL